MNSILGIVADLCGVGGMSFFLWAEIRQLWKILKTHKLTGISKTAYISKVVAVALTSVMLAISGLNFSLMVLFTEGVIVVWILWFLLRK